MKMAYNRYKGIKKMLTKAGGFGIRKFDDTEGGTDSEDDENNGDDMKSKFGIMTLTDLRA